MNLVRILISAFFLVLIALSVSGWVWTGSHQPEAQAAASRLVLTICILTGIAGLTAVWRKRPAK